MLARPVWHEPGISKGTEGVGRDSPEGTEGISVVMVKVEHGLGVPNVGEGMGTLLKSSRGTAIAQEAQKAAVTRAAKDLGKCMMKLNESGCNE